VKTCRNLLKDHPKLKEFVFDVHYVDTGGVGKKTILAVHGSPGSHNDFRQLIPKLVEKNFRVIGVNLPGHGRTPIDPYRGVFRHTTAERMEFLKDVLEALNVEKVDLFLSHSAGVYPMINYLAEYRPATALLMINPLGVSPHKIARPYWLASSLGNIYQTWTGRWLLRPYWYAACKSAFGPIKDVDYAAVVFAMASGIGYDKMPTLAKSVSKSHSRPIFLLYSTNDHLIEPEKSTELAEHLGISKENVLNFEDKGCDETILRKIDAVLRSDGQKAKLAIVFDNDGHFVHKKRPDFIADLVDMILNDKYEINNVQSFAKSKL